MDVTLLNENRVNWSEAFTHYCSGLPLADIALMLGAPLEKLETRSRTERWPTLKARVEAQSANLVPVHPDDLAKRAGLIQQNREENYAAWVKLRQHANEIIDQLCATKGKGMFKKYWHNKGAIVEHECDISMGDLNALANYMAVIAQGTYAALGDRISSSGAKDDATSSPSGVPTIQIILPGVIAKPRSERGVENAKSVQATVIEA